MESLGRLHIDQALAVIDFSSRASRSGAASIAIKADTNRLVSCDKFVLDRLELAAPCLVGEVDRCHILLVLEGEARSWPAIRVAVLLEKPVKRSCCRHRPGRLSYRRVTSRAVVLDAYLP